MSFIYIKIALYKVSFIGNIFTAPKVYQIQKKKIEIECNEILTCRLGFENLYFFFHFECTDGKTHEMFISRFSKKQLYQILTLIKERGGLQNQNIDEIMEYLWSNKKKSSKKNN